MNTAYVVILAAGQGKRFWPFTASKSLLPFLGKPLIAHSLERFAKAGFSKAIIVINPADVQFYMDLRAAGLEFHTVIQQEAVGMGDALLRVREHVGDSPILVVNAEDVVDDSLYANLASEVTKGKSFLTGKKVERYFDGGYLKIEGSRVRGIVEKPGEGREPSHFVNLVFHYIHEPKEFFQILGRQKSDRDDVYERALDAFIQETEVQFLPYDGAWYPMKYPWHVLDCMDYFLNSVGIAQGKGVSLAPNVVLDGAVYIGNNVKIFENTKIVGPAYIGDNTIIGNNNIIRQSHIGQGCVTGFNTDITRSYVGDASWFHSNYVGDSVLEGNVSMGSGSVLANLRLDEGEISSVTSGKKMNTRRLKLGAMIGEYVRIGVNTSIMPGVKIGADSFVGAGLTISSDVPERSFVNGEAKLTITKNTKSVRDVSREHYKKDIAS